MSVSRARPALVCALVLLLVPAFAGACEGSLHIELQRGGVYALDQATIVARQPDLADCPAARLALTLDGQEVPLRIVGADDGRFGPGARIEWVGTPRHGPESWFDPYSSVNAYVLSASPGEHLRMHPFAAGAASSTLSLVRHLHLEEQKFLVRLDQQTMKPGEEPDVWQWVKLTHVDPKPFVVRFDLPDLDRHVADARAQLRFRGMSSIRPRAGQRVKPVDHVVDVRLNGRRLASLDWDGRDEIVKDLTLPARLLRAQGNVLALRIPTRHDDDKAATALVDVVTFDAADLTYAVSGNLDASDTALATTGNAPGTVSLAFAGNQAIAFYGSNGAFRDAAPASGGRYHFGAPPEVTIYPVADGQFHQPTLLRAVAAGNLRAAAPGYDYLIVAHPNLIDAIEPLAAFHRKEGLKVAVIDVDAIYDQFNAGIAHPSAIRDLIAWGREHWQVKPRYVLLVGTASFDMRHAADPSYNEHQVQFPQTGVGKVQRADTAQLAGLPHSQQIPPDRNLIPTWQYPTPEGQAASDNAYVALDEGDYHPTLAIGRFPVVTPAEVGAIVKKTLDYAVRPAPGAWRSKVMFITNESEFFQKASDQIAASIEGEGFTTEKVYAHKEEKDNLAHQADIKANLDAGNLLVHFLGHGGRFIWRSGPPDFRKNHDLFTLDDVSRLHNGDRLPMILSMTCYSGSFDNPNSDTIGERFLREPGRGAVAVFAASWRNAPSPEFSRQLVDELLTPGRTIGDAILAAKRENKSPVLVETYNLFGDPALVLARPPSTVAIARVPDRWHQRIAVRLPADRFSGRVTVDWMDQDGNTLSSHTYATRSRQFQLPVPSGAVAAVNVYAESLGGGNAAIGNLDLRPPPPPPAPPPASVVAKAPAKPAPPRPARPRPAHLPDAIAQFDFDPAAGKTGKTGKVAGTPARTPALRGNAGES
jgi:hypothetical protein